MHRVVSGAVMCQCTLFSSCKAECQTLNSSVLWRSCWAQLREHVCCQTALYVSLAFVLGCFYTKGQHRCLMSLLWAVCSSSYSCKVYTNEIHHCDSANKPSLVEEEAQTSHVHILCVCYSLPVCPFSELHCQIITQHALSSQQHISTLMCTSISCRHVTAPGCHLYLPEPYILLPNHQSVEVVFLCCLSLSPYLSLLLSSLSSCSSFFLFLGLPMHQSLISVIPLSVRLQLPDSLSLDSFRETVGVSLYRCSQTHCIAHCLASALFHLFFCKCLLIW